MFIGYFLRARPHDGEQDPGLVLKNLKCSLVQSEMLKGAEGNRETEVLANEGTEHWHPVSCRPLITYSIFFLLPLNLSSGHPWKLFIQHLFI